jgi:hypothetical protein
LSTQFVTASHLHLSGNCEVPGGWSAPSVKAEDDYKEKEN